MRQSNAVAASRDNELLTEAAILGMRYLQITVYPMEAFEDGAELCAELAQFYAHCHGYRIKRAFARVLCALLLPVARRASAELNHPTWVQAITTLLPRAQGMAARARYWGAAYPLWAAALCAAPGDMVLTQWLPCVEAGLARWKDARRDLDVRAKVLRCAAQLLWAYLFRSHEGTNPTQRRLDAFFAQCLPPPRAPSDAATDAHVSMVAAVLWRQFEYGHALVLDMLCAPQLDASGVYQVELLQPARMAIAVRAVAAVRACYARGEPPAFPDEVAADTPAPRDVPFPSADVAAAHARFDELIGQIALVSDFHTKDVHVIDERVARGTPDEASEQRAHGALMAVYPRDVQGYLDVLRACFDAWPACLPATLAPATVHGALFRAQLSADPDVQDAAAAALMRLAEHQPADVVQAGMQWLFRQDGAVWELAPHADLLLPTLVRVASLLVRLLDRWWQRSAPAEVDAHAETLVHVEACAIALLCVPYAPIRAEAVTMLRLAGVLRGGGVTPLLERSAAAYLDADDARLTPAQRARIAKWRGYSAQRLARSNDTLNASLWPHALPALCAALVNATSSAAAVLRMHLLARLRAIDGVLERNMHHYGPLLLALWTAYAGALCAVSDGSTAEVTALLACYVSSDQPVLRDAATDALCHVPETLFVPLVGALLPLLRAPETSPARICVAQILDATASHLPAARTDERVRRALIPWVADTLRLCQAKRGGVDTAHVRLCRSACRVSGGLGAALPDDARARLVTQLREWHAWQHPARLAAILAAAAAHCIGAERESVIVGLRYELHLLAVRAEEAFTAVCSAAPLPLPAAHAALSWACELLVAPQAHASARAALASLLQHSAPDAFAAAVRVQCIGDLEQSDAQRTAFAVVAATWPCSSPADVAVGLVQLGHPDAANRVAALRWLSQWDVSRRTEAAAAAASVLGVDIATKAASDHPAVYLEAQRTASAVLAAAWPEMRGETVHELVHLADAAVDSATVLALLPPWLHGAHSVDGLFSMTLRHAQAHPMYVRHVWVAALASLPADPLATQLVRDVVTCRSHALLQVARLVVACSLSTAAGPLWMAALYAALSPESMVVPPAEATAQSDVAARECLALPPDLPPIALALPTLLCLCEGADSHALRSDRLPVLLHVLCLFVDAAPASALRMDVASAAQQVLVALRGGVSAATAADDADEALAAVMRNDASEALPTLVAALCDLGTAHVPTLRDAWAATALRWATACPVRTAACRSLELLCALRPVWTVMQLPPLYARLAETAAADAAPYVVQVLKTLRGAIEHHADEPVLTSVWWAAMAALLSPLDDEYAAALSLLDALLTVLDVRDPAICEKLLAGRPAMWPASSSSLITLAARGLCTAVHGDTAFAVLVRLADAAVNELVGTAAADERVMWTLAVALPWCMEACEAKPHVDAALVAHLGERLAALADGAQRGDIARVGHSIHRARFRAPEDLARQAATSLAAQGAVQPAALATQLLQLLHNDTPWVARHTLFLLQMFLESLHARSVALEHALCLDPLLQLLPTPLAPLALDVLDTPMLRAGGTASDAPPARVDGAALTRAQLQSVAGAWRASPEQVGASFVSEAGGGASDKSHELGSLASQLDDLASFFGQDEPEAPQVHSHVAKILARSTRDSVLLPSVPLDVSATDLSADTTTAETSRLFDSFFDVSRTRAADPFVVGRLARVPPSPVTSDGRSASPVYM